MDGVPEDCSVTVKVHATESDMLPKLLCSSLHERDEKYTQNFVKKMKRRNGLGEI
jgi:hypothetical protein